MARPTATQLTVVSFGYDKGETPRADLTIDCRGLPNPHDIPGFRPRSGLDRNVAAWVTEQPETQELLELLPDLAALEAIAVGCNAGRHRSVAIAERIAREQRANGRDVSTHHRDLKLKATSTTDKGLGWEHQKTRDRLLRQHIDGTPCWWCGRPMWKNRARNWDHNPQSKDAASGSLAADHTQARAHGGTTADRLLHGICNKERGDGTRDHLRPAVVGSGAATALGIRLLAWPPDS